MHISNLSAGESRNAAATPSSCAAGTSKLNSPVWFATGVSVGNACVTASASVSRRLGVAATAAPAGSALIG